MFKKSQYLVCLLLLSDVLLADIHSAHRAFESGNYKSAFVQLLPLAEAGNAEAQSNLAWLYRNGAGTDQDNMLAAMWYRKAAEQGEAYAQYNLAKMLEEGQGIEQDYVDAFYWYARAAKQGQANAQFSLGELYLDGAGTEQDFVRAYAWIAVVTRAGIESAEFVLEEIELEMLPGQLEQAHKLAEQLWGKYGSNSGD